MNAIFLSIVVFLIMLAIFDLMVGVSNDAVNFLNSAIGAKVAKFRTILIIASFGVLLGAMLSNGMMDIARHGIVMPEYFSFYDVMIIFLAVMVTDVVLLDVFNSFGMPTSTTVSMVFELLGAACMISIISLMMDGNGNITMGNMINTDKALEVIIGIFLSVAIAFVVGMVVMWLSRLVFTFNYVKNLRWTIALFGGISITALCYFMFIKGVKNTPLVSGETKSWINDNTLMLMSILFVFSTILTETLHLLKVNVFKIIILIGTFSLAMAFAGNDLVNFIGVPLAGLDSYIDFSANGGGDYKGFMMTSLMSSAKTPAYILFIAAIVMIVALFTSKKAQNVTKTEVGLGRQDDSDQMFGSSRAARSIVRAISQFSSSMSAHTPKKIKIWINGRFNKQEVIMPKGAAFDVVRASVNLVISGMLIILGTNLKLPLSTTYVTFMVAMGTSLADRAWGRESAVFRVTGVLSVIGGWFLTAGIAFVTSAIVAMIMYFLGIPAMIAFVILAVFLVIRSNIRYGKKAKERKIGDAYTVMLRSRDADIVWEMLRIQSTRTQSFVTDFVIKNYQALIAGLNNDDIHALRRVDKNIKKEREELMKYRRKELLCLRRSPMEIAIERNTWFHLAANADIQYMYCLKRMLDVTIEHVDNSFAKMPEEYIREYAPVKTQIIALLQSTNEMIHSGRYSIYNEVQDRADRCKDNLSNMRKQQLDRIQHQKGNANVEVGLVYLTILQESQELLSIMRHQLRATNKFTDKNPLDGINDFE